MEQLSERALEISRDPAFAAYCYKVAESFQGATIPETSDDAIIKIKRLLDAQCFELAQDQINELRKAGRHETARQLEKELAKAKALTR